MKYTFDNLPEYLVPIEHSALGTSWAKAVHKYIKKVGNKYYYNVKAAADTAKHTVQRAVNNVKKSQAKKAQADNAKYASAVGQMNSAAKNRQSEGYAVGKSLLSTSSKGRKQLAKAAVTKATRSVKNAAKKISDAASTAATKASAKTAVASRKVSAVLKKLGVSAKKSAQVTALNVKNASNRANTLKNAKQYQKNLKSAGKKARDYSNDKRLSGVLKANNDQVVRNTKIAKARQSQNNKTKTWKTLGVVYKNIAEREAAQTKKKVETARKKVYDERYQRNIDVMKAKTAARKKKKS